jgi:hypothetical protein
LEPENGVLEFESALESVAGPESVAEMESFLEMESVIELESGVLKSVHVPELEKGRQALAFPGLKSEKVLACPMLKLRK